MNWVAFSKIVFRTKSFNNSQPRPPAPMIRILTDSIADKSYESSLITHYWARLKRNLLQWMARNSDLWKVHLVREYDGDESIVSWWSIHLLEQSFEKEWKWNYFEFLRKIFDVLRFVFSTTDFKLDIGKLWRKEIIFDQWKYRYQQCAIIPTSSMQKMIRFYHSQLETALISILNERKLK